MMCARCDRPMTKAESRTYDIPGGSGAGGTVTVHKALCALPPATRTTTPVRYR